MPKLGMEPIRRDALVKATIAEVGAAGSLDVTVSRIARRAGVSSGLAHHYFGGKEDLLVAAMRHILTGYGAGVRSALETAVSPRDRLVAILAASFSPEHFEPHVITAWLQFYLLAQTNPGAQRLLRIYHARLHANLVHALRPRAGARAPEIAETAAALIDGLYLRHALGARPARPAPDLRVLAMIDSLLVNA